MKYLRLIFGVVFLLLLLNCEQICDFLVLYDYWRPKCYSYKVNKFYEKNKNNEKLAFFEYHTIYRPRENVYYVDGLKLHVNGTDITVKIPLGVLINERSKFYGRKNDILEGEEKEEYLKIFREYKKLSVKSIWGGYLDGYVEIEVITDYIYLYVVDHDSFDLDKYIESERPKDLKKIDDS